MQVLMHLAGFLPFVHRYEVLGVIRFHTHVEHLDVGFKHGVGQLWVLADLGPDLANHIHLVGVALPALQPGQALVTEFNRPQGRRMEVVRDKHLERTAPGAVDQAVGGQFIELGQPFELGFPGDHPVTEELLDDLTVGAAFCAPAYGFNHRTDHGIV